MERQLGWSSGQQVAGYQKKLLSMHATAYITVQEGGEFCHQDVNGDVNIVKKNDNFGQ